MVLYRADTTPAGLFVVQLQLPLWSAGRPTGCPELAQPCPDGARCNNHATPHRLSCWHPPLPGHEPEPEPTPTSTAGTTDVLVPPIDEVRWSIGRVRSCAWLQNPEVAEKRLALAKSATCHPRCQIVRVAERRLALAKSATCHPRTSFPCPAHHKADLLTL